MARPGRRAGGPGIVFLIPARDEEANLRDLLPQLLAQAPVIVFDDESHDATSRVAADLGAHVLRSSGLPAGWTGKNRACHELGLAAGKTDAKWFVFIDADVRVTPDFGDAVHWLIASLQGREAVITGFPRIVPGRGLQPLFLAWVGWILLSTSPYGVVDRTGIGHCRFTNGQFTVWPRELYLRFRPNEAVKSNVLEDVSIGRLLARSRVPVLVANTSGVFAVRMYDTCRQTLDGMSKNAYEITGSTAGSLALALLLFAVGWAWLAAPWSYIPLAVSGIASAATVRSRTSGLALAAGLMPVILTLGAYTIVRSAVWRRRGTVAWKGRTY